MRNDANRLVTLTQAETSKETYTYDGFGRRVTKKTYSWDSETSAWTLDMEERFVYNGWNLVAILNGSDVLQKHYTWGLDISGSEQGAGGVGGLLAVYDTSSSYFAYYDGNGNITAYSDGSNNSVATYFYSPFGAITEKSGLKKDDFNFKFSTKFFDNLANLYYYGFRYYSPRFARWINRDPIGIEGGINLYGMVGNKAINWVDYLGLIDFDSEGGAKEGVKTGAGPTGIGEAIGAADAVGTYIESGTAHNEAAKRRAVEGNDKDLDDYFRTKNADLREKQQIGEETTQRHQAEDAKDAGKTYKEKTGVRKSRIVNSSYPCWVACIDCRKRKVFGRGGTVKTRRKEVREKNNNKYIWKPVSDWTYKPPLETACSAKCHKGEDAWKWYLGKINLKELSRLNHVYLGLK